MPRPDLSFLRAATFVLREHHGVRMILVGCGGTGSFVARSIAQVARALIDMGHDARLTFVDPDVVEQKNVPRANFCDAEIGMPKAAALARRYSAAWGLQVEVVARRFDPRLIDDGLRHDWITILVGCVDNAAARKSIDACIDRGRHFTANGEGSPGVLWIDCGNARDGGLVLLGSTKDKRRAKGVFPAPTICTDVAAPSLQCPDLLQPRPEETGGHRLSCAELLALNAQSLSINQRVAAEAADFLMRLLVTRDLRRIATYFDVAAGVARSVYCSRPSRSASRS